MTKKRNRFKQTTTLDERLARFAHELSQKAERFAPDSKEAHDLRERIRQSEVALHYNAILVDGK